MQLKLIRLLNKFLVLGPCNLVFSIISESDNSEGGWGTGVRYSPLPFLTFLSFVFLS